MAKVKIIITCGLEYCLESRTQDVSRGEKQPTKLHAQRNQSLFYLFDDVWCMWSTAIVICVLLPYVISVEYIFVFVYGYFPWTPLFASRGGHLHTWVIISSTVVIHVYLSYLYIMEFIAHAPNAWIIVYLQVYSRICMLWLGFWRISAKPFMDIPVLRMVSALWKVDQLSLA